MNRPFVLLTVLVAIALAPGAHAADVTWTPWSNAAIEKAKREKRFVILDLRAVWCHWCHVMEETTYRDPKVVALLKDKYLTVEADQDANPDLSARYGDWGWPATIIFAPDGSELVKRRGYIPPDNMASLLQAVIDDPTPGPSVVRENAIVPATTSAISQSVREMLEKSLTDAYDTTNGGWGTIHKFIDTDSADWATRKAERGDATAKQMVRTTLDRATALIDPVWGGLYQYSDAEDWSSPHYEKIMWYQANGLRQYAIGYATYKDARYLKAANDIYRYLTTRMLGPDGAFFTSQDADVDQQLPGKQFYHLNDAERQKLGREPRIDKHIYARENGWAISGLVAFANATGDPQALTRATRAAEWIVANRHGKDGLFAHGDQNRGGPFISDTIAVGNAFLDLYGATGDRRWIAESKSIIPILARFKDAAGGFRSSMTADGAGATPFKSPDEQVAAARLATRLWRNLGDADAKALAQHAMQYVTSPDFVETTPVAPGVLLADDEFSREPTHITIVGKKDDASAVELYGAARAYPASNKRLDWWDTREGPLANADVTYPELDRAAAFACSNRLCSLPVFTPDALSLAVAQMSREPNTPLPQAGQ